MIFEQKNWLPAEPIEKGIPETHVVNRRIERGN